MKFFLLTLVIIAHFPTMGQTPGVSGVSGVRPSTTYTFIGEMRYGNKTPVYFNDMEYSFQYRDLQDRQLSLQLYAKEDYYPGKKGTGVVLSVDSAFVEQLHGKTLYLEGEFFLTLPNKKRKIKAPMHNIPINYSSRKQVSDRTFLLTEPLIVINEPEIFSVVNMINTINDVLDHTSSRTGGYSDIVSEVDRFVDRYGEDRKISYNQLLDFYRLFVFLDEYASDNSFFNQEAGKLQDQISQMRSNLSNTSSQIAPSKGSTSLLDEWADAVEVYTEYQKVYGRIKEYHSRLKLILFFKSK